MQKKIIRLPEVLKMTGMKRSTIYGKIKKNEFPVQVRLGNNSRCSGWIEAEILAWIDSCVADRDIKSGK